MKKVEFEVLNNEEVEMCECGKPKTDCNCKEEEGGCCGGHCGCS